ncbi:MAG: 23S rRNA (adenine(2030)-N(6))-methyltransferase RlmJ [Rhizomicrobium sp.]|jgi:23S rRNA (adenine2030-N6)-methyltransferase
MNYRHLYHAGNFADVAKHLALIAVLLHLRKKDGPFAVIDTHAGRGEYDLRAPEARRTDEAANGIGRLADVEAETPVLQTYLDSVRAGSCYPGSALIAAKLLRPQDRLIAIEKHPDDGAVLTSALRPFRKAHAEIADGYLRLAALLPPPERRGVVLIDPPYEAPDEFATAARGFAAAYRRFATGIYLVWFPIKSPAQASSFCGELLAAGAKKALRLDIAIGTASPDHLTAAGLFVANPPFGFAGEMGAALAQITPLLGNQDGPAKARIDWLAGAE